MLPIAPLPDTAFAFGGAAEILSPVPRRHENADLISHQRVAKSAPASGSVQTVCVVGTNFSGTFSFSLTSRSSAGAGTPEQTTASGFYVAEGPPFKG
jgi:hypothetical protein